MYQPPHFAPPSVDAVGMLMREHPLATLVHRGPDGLEADAVPLLYDADDGAHGTLRGHVARMNPLWRQADGQEVLLHFRGPQAYVSPGWYASKAEHGKVVPTWNYVVVNAHGLLRVVDDAAWLRRLVQRLTDTHESRRAQPWAVDDAPGDYVEAMLRAIVGIEIRLTRLEGKWKASQNRSAADRAGTVGGLRDEAGLPDPLVDALVREPTPRQA